MWKVRVAFLIAPVLQVPGPTLSQTSRSNKVTLQRLQLFETGTISISSLMLVWLRKDCSQASCPQAIHHSCTAIGPYTVLVFHSSWLVGPCKSFATQVLAWSEDAWVSGSLSRFHPGYAIAESSSTLLARRLT